MTELSENTNQNQELKGASTSTPSHEASAQPAAQRSPVQDRTIFDSPESSESEYIGNAQRSTNLKVEEALRALPLWRSFHVRVAGIVFLAFFLLTSMVAYVYYWLGYRSDLEFLQQRLLGIVTTLSLNVNGDEVETFSEKLMRGEPPERTPYHNELNELFSYVSGIDPDISTIYILLPTGGPAALRFYTDFDRAGDAAQEGESYDASELPILLKGFTHATVEPMPYRDVYGLSLSAYAPVKNSQGTVVGILGADVTVDRLVVMQKRVQHLTFWLAGSALLGVIVVAFLVGISLRRPLTKVMGAAQRVADGDLDNLLEVKRKDEFGVLADCFNRMILDLRDRETLRETFGRYMSKKIAHALLQKGETPNLGGETCMVTILFSDLKNYTRISESMGAQQLIATLNTYFGAMNEIIDNHGGCVIEFLGDGVLAVFGAPFKRESHATDAVRAANDMQDRLDKLNTTWEKSGTAYLWQDIGVNRIEMRIGIHTGHVVAGNMGSVSRMKYAVIGDTVNVASRLESLNNDLKTSVLISDEVRKELSPNLKKSLRSCGEHQVKGRDKPIKVYTVIRGCEPALLLEEDDHEQEGTHLAEL
ncbi:MAG: adenylate/guanylate cyclase domain-containing protein [Gammaproteobacteria bacterium]